ncbi:MAG: PEP-CTERM sorting domain-containing protein [Sphingomonadaceae bacterium]|nr:PEP-CTERM sorting domain-containing protein [Sphingomonadaceae bacterium]
MRKLTIVVTLALVALAGAPAHAAQILLGTFDGNDSESAIESVLTGLGRSTDVVLYDKSDDGQALTSFDVGDPAGQFAGNFAIVDPQMFVQFLVVKASNRFTLYEFTPFQNVGAFSSAGLANRNGKQHRISHLSFYANAGFVPQRQAASGDRDSAPEQAPGAAEAPTEVPEPATVGLLGLGALLLAARRRRRG